MMDFIRDLVYKINPEIYRPKPGSILFSPSRDLTQRVIASRCWEDIDSQDTGMKAFVLERIRDMIEAQDRMIADTVADANKTGKYGVKVRRVRKMNQETFSYIETVSAKIDESVPFGEIHEIREGY